MLELSSYVDECFELAVTDNEVSRSLFQRASEKLSLKQKASFDLKLTADETWN